MATIETFLSKSGMFNHTQLYNLTNIVFKGKNLLTYTALIYDIFGYMQENSESIDDILLELENLCSNKKNKTPNDILFGLNLFKESKLKYESELKMTVESTVLIKEGLYKCSKCGSRKVISNEMQVRSADEGTTVFCTCSNCGNKWKI